MAVLEISREQRIKAIAYSLGFDLAGIARLGPASTGERFSEWLARGYAGEMSYLERGARKRLDTREVAPGCETAIVVALNYGGTQPPGPIARYARGDDYHEVMSSKLRELHTGIETEEGCPVAGRSYVDTGPILERDLARAAGIGWFGKNTNLINPKVGSFLFLGALFVDLDLEPDPPVSADHCGTCTRCIDACPTAAIVAPRVLDATRCISYLTIEKRGAIPPEYREALGGLMYGCDICQDVCPWNVRFSLDSREPGLAARRENVDPDPREILALDDDGYRSRFRRSAIKRAKRAGLARNAAVALGNTGGPDDLPFLRCAAEAESDPMVREHINWAIEKIIAGAGAAE